MVGIFIERVVCYSRSKTNSILCDIPETPNAHAAHGKLESQFRRLLDHL